MRTVREIRVKAPVILYLDTRLSNVASRAGRFASGKENALLTERESAWIPGAGLEAFGQIKKKNLNKQDFMIQVLWNVVLCVFVFHNFSKERSAVIFKG